MKQRNLVRSIYLYAVTVAGIVMALTGLIGTLTNILNMYVFRLISSDSMPYELGTLLEFVSAVVVGIPVWLYHWGIIQGSRHPVSAATTPPQPVSATEAAVIVPESRRDLVRRIYIYLLSAIGLFIVMFSLINIVPNLYRAYFMQVPAVTEPVKPDGTLAAQAQNTYAIQSLIRNIVSVAVGTPVWLYHWNIGQREDHDLSAD